MFFNDGKTGGKRLALLAEPGHSLEDLPVLDAAGPCAATIAGEAEAGPLIPLIEAIKAAILRHGHHGQRPSCLSVGVAHPFTVEAKLTNYLDEQPQIVHLN